MQGIEEKIASEAVKPASSFIAALLGPKIEKMKRWANEKELQGKLDSNKLSVVMEEYLTKLSQRMSEITSISFPMLKLDIFKAYEPLHLGELTYHEHGQTKSIDFSDLIKNENKSFTIIDNAGMGKTTFSKFIVTQLLFKSERIPIIFELRKINKDLSLPENLAKELDLPGNTFNRDLFYKLLELGKFYVIIDGFDEVELDYQEKLANQIHELSIKGGENKLILTTRPQDTLPDIVNGTPLKFMPFTITQAKSLLLKYDEVASLDIGKRLIEEIQNVPDRFIESPLLVSLLYRTFGINNSIADRISTFYDEIYHALYKGHDLINKNGYGREKKSELDFEDFRKLLRSLCHLMMLSKKTSFVSWSEAIQFIDKAAYTSSITPKTSSEYLDDLLVAVPLMQREGTEYKFFHKTILEYFAAEYLVFDKSSSTLLKKIFESKLAPSFNKTFEFLSDINSSLFDSVITHHFADLASQTLRPSDTRAQILTALIFKKNLKIGIWSADEYTKNSGERSSFDLSKAGEPFSTTAWGEVETDGKKYFVAVTATGVRHNLHDQAWNSITKPVTYSAQTDINYSNCAKELIGVFGINKWVDVDIEVINQNHHNDFFFDIASDLYSFHHSMDSENYRVLCTEKINAVLTKIKKESDFELEMESFL